MKKEPSSPVPIVAVEKPLVLPASSVASGPYQVTRDEYYGWLVTFSFSDPTSAKYPVLYLSDKLLFVDCVAIVAALNGAHLLGKTYG